MKKSITNLFIILLVIISNVSYSQWTTSNGAGNINNTNVNNVGVGITVPTFKLHVNGTIGLNGTLDQRSFNPSGSPIEPGSSFAQVNANFGGLIIHSSSYSAAVMNTFWGQNFDYHSNSDIRYRINGPSTLLQFANGNMYFYTGATGLAGTQIPNFKFQPKISLANNGGFAIGNVYAINNTSAQGTLLVQNSIGLGTQNPNAQLHTTGTVIFQGLSNGGVPNNLVSIDANGQLWRSALTTGGVQNYCTAENFVTKSTSDGNINCSQIFDDGTFVGIGTTSPYFVNGELSTLNVNGLTVSTSFYSLSDKKYKKNIETIKDATSIINQLRGVNYSWNKEAYPNKKFEHGMQAGFIAQEVKNVYPIAVAEDGKEGFLVNYSSFIPLLVQAQQELNKKIEEISTLNKNLQAEIANLRNQINEATKNQPNSKQTSNSDQKNNLSQNRPNPFDNMTTIDYTIASMKSSSYVIVYDLTGKELARFRITSSGKGSVQIDASKFSKGMYLYSLVIDGIEADTKKMTLLGN